jgi:hypothetical protein
MAEKFFVKLLEIQDLNQLFLHSSTFQGDIYQGVQDPGSVQEQELVGGF